MSESFKLNNNLTDLSLNSHKNVQNYLRATAKIYFICHNFSTGLFIILIQNLYVSITKAMNVSSPKHIKKLFMNRRERLHEGRNRLGFHVFLSRFIMDFRMLPLHQQKIKIYNDLSINLFPPDDVSIDSTCSCIDEKVQQKYVMKIACKYWSCLYSNKMKNAWKDRAIILNARKLPGKFITVPNNITHDLNNNVMDSLTYEWKKFIGIMKNSITKPPRRTLACLTYKFGKYSVRLQTHCSSPKDQIAETPQTPHDYAADQKSAGINHKITPSINVITKQFSITETHIQT